MRKRVLGVLLFLSILAGLPGIAEACEKMDMDTEQEMVTPEEGTKRRAQNVITSDTITFPSYFSTPDEKYINKNGYFYVYVRKKGEPIEKGYWYKCSISVGSLSAKTSQDIKWEMKFLGTMPKSHQNNVKNWLESVDKNPAIDTWLFSFDIEKGENWEKTRQDNYGVNPVLGDQKEFTEEEKKTGLPYPQRYYMMCGKFLYSGNGYRLYFDQSAFGNLKGMDIEPENKDIQKKDEKLEKGEKPWTGEDYFKFAIDTNNVGMTNYGASGEFHNCMYGFYLKPNPYTIKFHANGGTGKMGVQNAVVDKELSLSQNKFTRAGHTFQYWMDTEDGADILWKFQDRETVVNLTRKYNKTVDLYAKWKPNTMKIKYHANGGTVEGTPSYDINEFSHTWLYTKEASDLGDFKSFGLVRKGYHRKAGREWNTKADGTGRAFDQGADYIMTAYAPELVSRDCALTMYAQWEPNTYTVTLENGIQDPDVAGTKNIYEKYDRGWYLDIDCTSVLQEKDKQNKITIPRKIGYHFQGYYDSQTGGKQMIDKDGKLTPAGTANYQRDVNTTWYARYNCQVKCEDYADIPCDLEEIEGDQRESLGIRLLYDKDGRKVKVKTGKTWSSVNFTGKPAGTRVGSFQSVAGGNSASGETRESDTIELSFAVQEGAAYQLHVASGVNKIFDQLIYFKNGRFRTFAKLGEQEAKNVQYGGSIKGESWGTEEPPYTLYQYQGCTQIDNVKKPETVYRYYRYKGVNVAYSGNGATSGRNMLEYGVSLENMYQFRENQFKKEKARSKQTMDGKRYWCDVKYQFEGWETNSGYSYQEKQLENMSSFYTRAKRQGMISQQTSEAIHSYEIVKPTQISGSVFPSDNAVSKKNDGAAGLQERDSSGELNSEYINLRAKWNEFPTIVVTPGDKLEFYEGEEVTKDDLVKHLTAHDEEDSENQHLDLNQSLRIVKVSYPKSKNGSQKAYEKTFQTDVPEDFLLDTYYLKLETEETVKVLVTFAVTDSKGNTTKEEIPVNVRYNNYPEICSEDIFYYFKSEVNRGEVTEQALLSRVMAKDKEDGDVTQKLSLKDFDPQLIKMQSESKAEFLVTYQVTDAYRKTTCKVISLMVWDEDAEIAEMPSHYVRFISEKYLDTLEQNSVWREPQNFAYLKQILENETPMEIWEFSHEDVLAVQKWVTNEGNGDWKIGQEANQEFLHKFAYCKK